MSKALKARSDRCCNPYKDSGVDDHKGKDLRYLSKTLKQKFPFIFPEAKICWDCRHHNNESFGSRNSQSSQNLLGNDEDDIDMDNDNSSTSDAVLPPPAAVMFRSQREVELEEMLEGLKVKFANLSVNDPEKLKILTIAPQS